MSITMGFVQELKHEAISTRKHLERVPEAKMDYKPHAKSMNMTSLASHIVEIPDWGSCIVNEPEFDIPMDYKTELAKTTADLLSRWDKNFDKCIADISKFPDSKWMEPWTLKWGGNVVFTMPRIAVMRSMVCSHLVHHRAQLGVYLRLNNIAVPSAYGPSADEES